MGKKYTNYEMLLKGLQHIANNYGLEYGVEELFGSESHYILGDSIAMRNDVSMLYEDLNINELGGFDSSVFGVEILIYDEWKNTIGKEYFKDKHLFWKRRDVEL